MNYVRSANKTQVSYCILIVTRVFDCVVYVKSQKAFLFSVPIVFSEQTK